MFQSTPPHGGRHAVKTVFSPSCKFQSTPPHGGRRSLRFAVQREVCFNPRPRMGGDRETAGKLPFQRVSIHAPAWGATQRR